MARNAWQRMADMIESWGQSADGGGAGGGRVVPRWRLFDDPIGARDDEEHGPDAIFGLDGSLHDLVMTIRAGARGSGQSGG